MSFFFIHIAVSVDNESNQTANKKGEEGINKWRVFD